MMPKTTKEDNSLQGWARIIRDSGSNNEPLELTVEGVREFCATEAMCLVVEGPRGVGQGRLWWKPGTNTFVHDHRTGEHTYETIEEAIEAFNKGFLKKACGCSEGKKHCTNCEEDTMHTNYCFNHEQDGEARCHKCGWYWDRLNGNYHPPTEERD